MLEAPGNADTDALPQFESAPISQLLLKVAARCNIDCSYCYWFRDASVYQKPKLMSAEVLSQFLLRLEEHIVRHHLEEFTLILHGGEPLLWGIENFRRIGRECRAISRRSGCPIQLAVTTNGILIDDRWVDCLKTHEISVTISLDGPSHIHDIHRRTFQGRGTHAAVEQAVRLLQAEDVPVNALAVCNPAYHP